jgi:hypothetical protein
MYILTKSIPTVGSVNGANCKELATQLDVGMDFWLAEVPLK